MINPAALTGDVRKRVQDEYDELEARHVKLRIFMEENGFWKLDPKQQMLLVKQEMVMGLYREILFARLDIPVDIHGS